MAEEKIVLTLNEEVEEEKKVEMQEIPQNSYSEEDILTEEQKKRADVNGDGKVDFKDIVKINQFRLNKIK